MGLPNIGPLELIIILAIALLIVGPGRLPEMGNAIGRTIREFRKASSDMTDAIDPDKAPSSGSADDKPAPPPNTLSTETTPNTTMTPAPATSSKPAGDGEDDA
jgi:sec-independent protein translocase protein TatA